MGRERRRVIARRKYGCGLTPEQVAEELGIGARSYYEFEAGRSMLRDGRLPQLARILKWSPEDLRLAIEEDERPLAPNGHVTPSWLDHFAANEQGASVLRAFEPVVVHGLLQTPEYATAVEQADANPKDDAAIAQRVHLRMARQAVLDREPAPLRLHVVLDESVLLRVAGSRQVMATQLRYLIDRAQYPNVDLQVLPLSAGRFSAAFGSFTLFTSPGSDEPYMACTEDRAGVTWHDREPDRRAHIDLFKHLVDVALDPDQSIKLISKISTEEYQ